MRKLLLVLPLAVLMIFISCGRKSIQEELAQIPASEQRALKAILAKAQLTPEQLDSVSIWALEKYQRAAVFENGHLVGLRITGTQLNQVDTIKGLPALKALWLDGNQITKLTDLAGHPELTTLSLTNNQLESLEFINNLPKLKILNIDHNRCLSLYGLSQLPSLKIIDLSHNQITDLIWLTKLTSLIDIDAANNSIKNSLDFGDRHVDLAGNPLLSPTPPKDYVTELPYLGNNRPGYSLTRIGDNVYISFSKVSDAVAIDLNSPEFFASKATLELTVASGKVRTFMHWPYGGYIYTEATADQPGRLTGHLVSVNSTFNIFNPDQGKHRIVVEVLDGDATGIKIKLNFSSSE